MGRTPRPDGFRQRGQSPGGTVTRHKPSILSSRVTTLSVNAPCVQMKNGSMDGVRDNEASTTASSPVILELAIDARALRFPDVRVMRRRKSSRVSRAWMRGASRGHASSGRPLATATSHARVTPSGEVRSLVSAGRLADERLRTIAAATSAKTATPIHPVNRSMPLLSSGGTLLRYLPSPS